MRTKLLSTLAVVALTASAPAWGQAPATSPSSGPAKMAAPPSQQPGQVTTDKLIGRSIQNAQNETIGEIEAVVLDPDGKVGAVVVGVGGFLGIGQRDVAIQWTALEVGSNGEKVTTALTKDQLKALPEYRYAEEKLRGTVFTTHAPVPPAADTKAPPRSAPPLATQADLTLAPGAVGTAKLVGLDVRNSSEQSIGEIKDVILADNGKAQAVIIAVGGFLGVGERNVAVSWDSIDIHRNSNSDVIVGVAFSKQQIEALPHYRSVNGGWTKTYAN